MMPGDFQTIPEETHESAEGRSLSDYLRAQIQAVADRATTEELRKRLESRSRVRSRESAAEAVRAERDAR